ncbi:membrane-bound lytic murein transglycosylase B [Motilibacter peucedani]|uniref:Membrane-bound lytic murein transglycosylase B n=1 Tax=Motilibacter peucedani TaxID=598650 RepID=A0A420XKT5_9ACTN|nr:lytic murein transglycosylase [Motilibacter peucedani]RKS69163.1 membrane-bound lytic murein transglycosylase B [Motilibacter peucedani]
MRMRTAVQAVRRPATRRLPRPATAAALACVPVLLVSASALSSPGPAPAPAAALPAAPARPALGLQEVAAPVPSAPVVGSLGDELREQASAAATQAPVTAARVVPAQLLSSGIPAHALSAYISAAALLAQRSPGCHLSWPVLAGIGRVESNHGRFGGSVLGADGVPVPAIVGPRLDGGQFAAVADSDGGALDGDTEFDRAVGPMQFLPSTWVRVAVDADHDGTADPQDIDDAAAAAGVYLCSGGRDLRTGTGLGAAIFSYNHSADYVNLVAAVAQAYASGKTAPIPDVPASTPSPTPTGKATP